MVDTTHKIGVQRTKELSASGEPSPTGIGRGRPLSDGTIGYNFYNGANQVNSCGANTGKLLPLKSLTLRVTIQSIPGME